MCSHGGLRCEVLCMHCTWQRQAATGMAAQDTQCMRLQLQTCGGAAPGQARAHPSTCLMRFIVSFTCGEAAWWLAIARVETGPTAAEQNHL